MQQFHDMLEHILEHGVRRPNRTGHDTVFVPGYHLRFDLQKDGFPAITTKRLAFKSAVGELLGFFRGYDSAAQFRELGCRVWDGNANSTASWLANPHRKGTDDLGRIYSKQWTDWRDWREVHSQVDADALMAKGYELIAHDTSRSTWVLRRGINQLETALHALMTNPTDRRILINAWRPDEFDQASLPPCHCDWNLLADTQSGTLHLCMYQRSFDTFLAFNVAMGGIFLEVMAKLAGFTAGTFNHFIGDAHIYVNHFEQTRLLLSREHFEQPRLQLGASIPTLQSPDEIPGVFTRIQPEDITLVGYQHHPAIPAPMAA